MIAVSLDDPDFAAFVVVTVALIIVGIEWICWCLKRRD